MIEPLESRIAPATLVNPTTVTFTDVDGDLVTVKTSKPVLDAGAFTFNTAFGDTGPQQLRLLDLQNSGPASGTGIAITATRGPTGGDGFVNVGFVDASGTDLAAVVVDGDLGRIEAGDPNTNTPGLKSLTVQSMGEFGTSTQSVGGNLQTVVNGALGSHVVKGSVREAIIDVTGGANGKLGAVKIGGALLGGATADSGSLESTGAMGNVTIGGDVRGGSGNLSGRIHAIGNLGNVTIGGSLFGGSGVAVGTGEIAGVNIGVVKIAGDIKGGTAGQGARIDAGGKLAGLSVGGSVIGSLNQGTTAEILVGGDIGPVKIGGDLHGFRIGSARIQAGGKIASVTIGGSVEGGDFGDSGKITAAGNLGAIKIGGDLTGGDGGNNAGFIGTTAGDLTSLTIGGSIIGGGGNNSGAVQIGGDLGPVKISGDLRGGSAGVASGSGLILSTEADAFMTSLTIGGSMLGGSQGESAYVFADRIGSISVLGSIVGGTGSFSGAIASGGLVGSIKIGVNLVGGSASGADNLVDSGAIRCGRINQLTVGGSIIAGTDQTSGAFVNCGAVRAQYDIGTIAIKGSLIGNSTNPVFIGARGQEFPPATSNLAIKSLTVAGRVEFGRILAGFSPIDSGIDGDGGVSADAQIGTIKVGGDWIASSVLAGVDDNDTDGDAFADETGDVDDTKLIGALDTAGIVSRIASITIKGQARGTVGGADHFGFVAQHLGMLSIGGTKLPLTAGVGNDLAGLALGATGDLRVREVAL